MTAMPALKIEDDARPKPLEPVAVAPPPPEERRRRAADFAEPGQRRTRYSLPTHLESGSPVGFRTRLPLSREEVVQALRLFALERPSEFASSGSVTERELFEEASLGVLSSRQSTNFNGHRQTTFGPADSARLSGLLRRLDGLEAPVLDGAAYTHVVFSRPYRTPFTFLLTLVGHPPVVSPFTVALRALRKRFQHADDIPTIGYLQHLHLGILADAMERAAVLASGDERRAQIFMAPFAGDARRRANAAVLEEIEAMCGLSARDRRQGWRVALVAQVGAALPHERVGLEPELCRKLGANLLALRSERIQPGVNAEESAPAQYHQRQSMDVPDELTVMAGRAAYNAFSHWTGVSREEARRLALLERVDVLTPNGKERLRDIRRELDDITDEVVRNLPLWADLPTGRALSRNAARGRKAFALAGQRIYIGGLSRREVEEAGLVWEHAVRAFGAAASRSGLVAELAGCQDLPSDCDLLTGVCLMAGPVNQNDIGKSFQGRADLLASAFPERDPTSLLVWTLKAKTVADPIGNEEQLLNRERKGALVDLRPAPHEVVQVVSGGRRTPMRHRDGKVNAERAFAEWDNFVVAPDGREIPGNRGSAWPAVWSAEAVWPREQS